MSFELIFALGGFFAKKTVDYAYNSTYSLIFGSESSKLHKKLDKLIQQNDDLKKEIDILKSEYSNQNNNCNYELVILENYIENKNDNKLLYTNQLSKTLP
jgi:cell division protein FtsB